MAKSSPNQRRAPRISVLGHGVIIAPDVRAHCIIRDISSTGAKLGISKDIKLPAVFDVWLRKTGSKRCAILRWRRGDFVGVEFGQHTAAATSDPTSDEQEVWIG